MELFRARNANLSPELDGLRPSAPPNPPKLAALIGAAVSPRWPPLFESALPRDGVIIFSDLIGKLDPWPSRAAPELLPCAEDHRCCPVRTTVGGLNKHRFR